MIPKKLEKLDFLIKRQEIPISLVGRKNKKKENYQVIIKMKYKIFKHKILENLANLSKEAKRPQKALLSKI